MDALSGVRCSSWGSDARGRRPEHSFPKDCTLKAVPSTKGLGLTKPSLPFPTGSRIAAWRQICNRRCGQLRRCYVAATVSALPPPSTRRAPGRGARSSGVLMLVASPACLERLDQPPAEIDLTRQQPKLRRARIGMVIVVPALAHADQPGDADIVALGRDAFDDPGLAALAMRVVADQPVTSDADADAHANAPDQPAP